MNSTTTMLRIHLFGHLRAFDGDAALPPLNPPKALALWAYLLLRRDQPVPRDQVAFALWTDVPEAEARANLRRHLHLLRRYLPRAVSARPWLISEHETVQWNRQSDYWLDVEAFKQAADERRQTAVPAASHEAIAHLQSAIGHYGGDLLENFYDDWVLAERERLREQFTEMLERLAALQESVGDLRGAIATAKRLLANNPLREETHRRLMELSYLAGDRTAALRQFDECQRLLREELDVEPVPETLELRQAILEGAGRRTPPRPPLLVPPAVDLSPPRAERFDRAASRTAMTGGGIRSSVAISRLSARARWLLIAGGLALVVAALLLWPTLLSPPVTVTLSGPGVAQDTWITSEYPGALFNPGFPEDLFKDYSQVHLQFYDVDLDRFLIRFDLSTVPAGAQVNTASLLIHLETWTADSGQNSLDRAYPAMVTAYRIRRPWQPETATFNSPWTQPGLASGMDYDAEPLASRSTNGTAWLSFDITSAVRDWLAYPDDNWGVMLKITDAPEGVAHYWVDTTDHPAPARRPQLMVTYRSGAARGSARTLTLSGTDGADTWITSGLPNAASASALRGQPADELVWVTAAFDNITSPAGQDVLDIPFEQYPRARLNKAGQTISSALLWFDLARLPAGARVARAALAVFLEPARLAVAPRAGDAGPFPATLAVYRLLRPWQPHTVTFSFPWTLAGLAPGVDYEAEPLDTRPVNGAAWLTFDVASAVQAWRRGDDNSGLLLAVQEATEGLAPYWMATGEFPDPAFHPRLQIQYRSD